MTVPNDPCLRRCQRRTLHWNLARNPHITIKTNHCRWILLLSPLRLLLQFYHIWILFRYTCAICCISWRFLILTCFKKWLLYFPKTMGVSRVLSLLFSKIKSLESHSVLLALLHRKTLSLSWWSLFSCKFFVICRSASNDRGHTRVL